MGTFRLSGYDAIPLYEKIKTGIKDSEGTELYLIDTVVDDMGEKHIVVNRYGMWALKQPNTMHTIPLLRKDGTPNGSPIKKVNVITVFSDYVICCEDENPLYETVKQLLGDDD